MNIRPDFWSLWRMEKYLWEQSQFLRKPKEQLEYEEALEMFADIAGYYPDFQGPDVAKDNYELSE